MKIKLVIDGKEIELVPNGNSKNYLKFKEPEAGNGDKPLIVSVYVRPGWAEA